MAASMATSLSSLSHRLSLRPKPLLLLPHKPSLLSFSLPPPSPLLSLRCTPPEAEESETYPEQDPEAFTEPRSGYEGPMFDWPDDESVEAIDKDYEELYGAAFSADKFGNDLDLDDLDMEETTTERPVDDFEERVLEVRRVTKVVKGGKNMSFRAVVAVGDKKGHVGIGMSKALEVTDAVVKAVLNGRRNIVTVPLTKHLTFPHRANGRFGAAEVMLRPAAPGSGIQAGGVVRTVLELAGLQNALGKQLRSGNALNNARATIVATQQMRHIADVAKQRGIPMQELWK